jgi:hypothetical protein
MCGAFMRRCWLPGDNAGKSGDNAGKNAAKSGFNAGKNASRNARARRWSLQAAPVVTPGRAARSGAFAVSLLLCLCAGLASATAARRPGLITAPERPLSDASPLHGLITSAATIPAVLARSTALCLSGVRACSSVKRGDCRDLPGSAWICRNSPDLAQCPRAPVLGTVGGMSHATQNAPQRTQRAPALPGREARATCTAVAKPAQECPTRTVALLVLGRMRDNLSCAVRHDGGPRYVGRLDVDSTRSAAFPLRPPDALGLPNNFELGGSSLLTAWRRASWLRARSVGHSGAGSVSPMQGQHAAHSHYPQASAEERREPRASVAKRRGILRSAALPRTERAAPVREGSQP